MLTQQDETLNCKRIVEAAEGPIDCLLDMLGPIRDATLTRKGVESRGQVREDAEGMSQQTNQPVEKLKCSIRQSFSRIILPSYAPRRVYYVQREIWMEQESSEPDQRPDYAGRTLRSGT